MNHQQSTDPQAQRDAIYQYAIAPAGIWFDISKAAYDFWTKREVSKTRIVYANPKATEPAGYKLVPVEPSVAMYDAARNHCADYEFEIAQEIYRAMLAAAPEANQ